MRLYDDVTTSNTICNYTQNRLLVEEIQQYLVLVQQL